MEKWFVEIRSTVKRSGAPRLVPLETVEQYTGFRSVFAVSAEVAEIIRESGGTSYMRGVPVYSDVLLVDFDDCDPTYFIDYLRSQEISFSTFRSGNRSIHVHANIQPMYGPNVPHSQKAWVKKHAPNADTSYFHQAGQFRLPRTYHEKNPGHRKELIELHPGKLLVIPEATQPKLRTRANGMVRAEDLVSLLTTPVSQGGRRPHCWLIAVTAADLGMDFEETIDLVSNWNTAFSDPPHDPSTLIKQCEAAYERQGRLYNEG
jgi:hypothetical protein